MNVEKYVAIIKSPKLDDNGFEYRSVLVDSNMTNDDIINKSIGLSRITSKYPTAVYIASVIGAENGTEFIKVIKTDKKLPKNSNKDITTDKDLTELTKENE